MRAGALRSLSTSISKGFSITDLDKSGGINAALDFLDQNAEEAAPLLYSRLLCACKDAKALQDGKRVHRHMVKHRFEQDMFLGDLLVDMYAKCGTIEDTFLAFCGIPNKGTATWGKMIQAFAQKGQFSNALILFWKMQLEGIIPNRITFIFALNACAGTGAVTQAAIIHACIDEAQQHTADIFVITAIVNAYGKCGELGCSRRVFDAVECKDIVIWTAMITTYAEHGHFEEALDLYEQMQHLGIPPNRITFIALLSACTGSGILREGKLVHCHMIESGVDIDNVLANAIITMYDKCGSLHDAQVAFDGMKYRDVVSWTAIIAANAQNEKCSNAILLYRRMQLDGVAPNRVTYITILDACAGLATVREGKAVHAAIIWNGLESDVVVATALVNMYGKFAESVENARSVFERIHPHDGIIWNSLITAYAQHGHSKTVVKLYERMQEELFQPDVVTFINLLAAFDNPSALCDGFTVHKAVIEHGFDLDIVVQNALINMYGKCGCPEEARSVFNGMTVRNTVSWNSLLAAYSQNGWSDEAYLLFRQMQLQGVVLDRITLVTMLYACTSSQALDIGNCIQAVVRFQSEAIFGNALVVMHGKCGKLIDATDVFQSINTKEIASCNAMISAYGYQGCFHEARCLFDEMTVKDVSSWNAMLAAYAQHERCDEAFDIFRQMQIEGELANIVTFVTVLSSCASSTALKKGKIIHKFADECVFSNSSLVTVCNSIINMYSKCGSLIQAQRVFDTMQDRDVISWNALIAAYAQHGNSDQAFELFTQMQLQGLTPDKVSFASVLGACTHVGLLSKGYGYLSSISLDYGMTPTGRHYGCIIDILGRSGRLKEAENFLNKISPSSLIPWMSLLGSCRIHSDPDRAKKAAERVFEFDPKNSAAHIVLSNIYDAQR